MGITTSDIEFIVIYTVLALLFLCGLKPKKQIVWAESPLFTIDLPMSQAMKGLACIMILTSHWGLKRFGGGMEIGHISKIVWSMAANIALVWFMFFSGYGMSLKNIGKSQVCNKWKKSCLKVYVPCLLVCLVTFVLFAFLPDNIPASVRSSLGVDEDIHLLHHLTWNSFLIMLPNLLGHEFWYVECILIFYSMFYVSAWIAVKYGKNITIVLSAFFLVYFVLARVLLGPNQAHFYRFVWTFMFGHAVAKQTRISWIVAILFLLTTLVEKEMMNIYLWSIIGLLIISLINQKFEMKGKLILYLGSISYIYYLSHIRIAYHLLVYIRIDSIIVWTLLATVVSSILYEFYNRVIKNKLI